MISGTEKSQRNRKFSIVIRGLISFATLALVVKIANPAEIFHAIAALTRPALFFALGLHTIIILTLAWRWAILVRTTGQGVSYPVAIRTTFVSTVLNLVLPTSVGGDISRVWLGRKQGVALVSGSAAAILDRGTGLVSLLLMVTASAIFLGKLVVVVILAVTLMAGVLVADLLRRWTMRLPKEHAIYRLVDATRGAMGNWLVLLLAHGVSLASHLAAALIAALLAHGMGLQLSVLNAFLLFPAVLLATAIPISIGGWGIRELIAIPTLGLAGLDAEGAAAIALVFGLTQITSALIGTLVVSFLLMWRPAL